MRVKYHCSKSTDPFCNYYNSQAAYGLPVYSGQRNQRGHGFFSNLFRFAIPLIKKGGISLAKHFLNTGRNIVSDVEAGKPIGESAKSRFIETGKGVLGSLTGHGRRKINKTAIKHKRQKPPGSLSRCSKKRKVAQYKSDIFST